VSEFTCHVQRFEIVPLQLGEVTYPTRLEEENKFKKKRYLQPGDVISDHSLKGIHPNKINRSHQKNGCLEDEVFLIFRGQLLNFQGVYRTSLSPNQLFHVNVYTPMKFDK